MIKKILDIIMKYFNKVEHFKIMLDAYKTQGFGENPENYKQYNLAGHEGVDYSTKGDRTIYSPERGIVERDYDKPCGAYGNYVVIYYPDSKLIVYFAHLKENFVEIGDVVERGDIIGIMGNTGNSTGAHLHISGKKINEKKEILNLDNGYKGFVDIEKIWIRSNNYI